MAKHLFEPGNQHGRGAKGRSGRPPKSDEFKMMSLLQKNFPDRKRAQAIRRLVTLAIDQDNLEAYKLLFGYIWGRPRQALEHSGSLTVGHATTWLDVEEQCHAMNLDPVFARAEVMNLVESASVEPANEDE